jgi:hypothetical protein
MKKTNSEFKQPLGKILDTALVVTKERGLEFFLGKEKYKYKNN